MVSTADYTITKMSSILNSNRNSLGLTIIKHHTHILYTEAKQIASYSGLGYIVMVWECVK